MCGINIHCRTESTPNYKVPKNEALCFIFLDIFHLFHLLHSITNEKQYDKCNTLHPQSLWEYTYVHRNYDWTSISAIDSEMQRNHSTWVWTMFKVPFCNQSNHTTKVGTLKPTAFGVVEKEVGHKERQQLSPWCTYCSCCG